MTSQPGSDQASEAAAPTPSAALAGPVSGLMRGIAYVLLVALGLALTLATFAAGALLEAFEVEGPSNEPGLLNGDRVITIVPLPIDGARLEPGALVIATTPDGEISLLKRVVATAGDRVWMMGGEIIINDRALPMHDEGKCSVGIGADQSTCRVYRVSLGEHTFRVSFARPPSDTPPTEVPEGHVYLLGDHLDMSNDSRNPALGTFPIDAIDGVALSVYWSSDADGIRWDRFPSPVR